MEFLLPLPPNIDLVDHEYSVENRHKHPMLGSIPADSNRDSQSLAWNVCGDETVEEDDVPTGF